jgi:hypothetical protein
MRRTVSSILLIAVFISLQFGKVASYIYCKWQAEIVFNDPDCDCDDHLISIYNQHDDANANNDESKITLHEKLNEFTPKLLITVSPVIIVSKKSFAKYISSLTESFIEAPFHPPIT